MESEVCNFGEKQAAGKEYLELASVKAYKSNVTVKVNEVRRSTDDTLPSVKALYWAKILLLQLFVVIAKGLLAK